MWISSLVPRPSHRPAFAVCKNGGGRPGVIYHVNDVSVYQVDRGGEGSQIERTHFAQAFFVSNQGQYAFRYANVSNSSAWGRN